MRIHSDETMNSLKGLDSPTVANAIERFDVRPRTVGFAGWDIRCAFPELETMLGYAVTCTADSMTEGRPNPRGLFPLWEAIEASPKPAIMIIKDIGPEKNRSCHLGEVMATTAKALGAVGCVSDGGLRDIVEIRELGGFHLFCPGYVVSHGNPVILDVGVEVELNGLVIRPGDLLHGDVNGLLCVPDEIADQVADEAAKVRAEEAELIGFAKSDDFSLEALRELQKFSH